MNTVPQPLRPGEPFPISSPPANPWDDLGLLDLVDRRIKVADQFTNQKRRATNREATQ